MELQTGLESPQVKDDIKIPTPMELQTDSEYECPFDDYEVLGGTRLEVVGKNFGRNREKNGAILLLQQESESFMICNDFQTSESETGKSHPDT